MNAAGPFWANERGRDPTNNSATRNGGAGIMQGKVVLVIDVPEELDGLLPEFVRLTHAEARSALHLIAAILQARGTGGPER